MPYCHPHSMGDFRATYYLPDTGVQEALFLLSETLKVGLLKVRIFLPSHFSLLSMPIRIQSVGCPFPAQRFDLNMNNIKLMQCSQGRGVCVAISEYLFAIAIFLEAVTARWRLSPIDFRQERDAKHLMSPERVTDPPRRALVKWGRVLLKLGVARTNIGFWVVFWPRRRLMGWVAWRLSRLDTRAWLRTFRRLSA